MASFQRPGENLAGWSQSSSSMWTACSRGMTWEPDGIVKPFRLTSLHREMVTARLVAAVAEARTNKPIGAYVLSRAA